MALIESLVGGILLTQGVNAIDNAGNTITNGKWDRIKGIKNKAVNIMQNSHGNIVNLVSDYAVEPLILVTEAAFNLPSEIVNNGCNSLRDLFASYYIRAFNIIITNMGLASTDAIKILSSNNRREGPGSTLLTLMESSEDNRPTNIIRPLLTKDQELPIPEYDIRYVEGKKYLFSAEDYYGYYMEDMDDVLDTTDRVLTTANNGKVGKRYNLPVDNPANVNDAYGDPKKYNAPLIYKIGSRYLELSASGLERNEDGDPIDHKDRKSYNIKIEVSGKVIRVNLSHLKAYITPKLDENSFSERYKKWRAGVISFKEFAFANDLVNDYKKIKAKQATPINYINELRQISSIKSQANYGIRGTQANYNMLMITREELRELCRFTNIVITRYDDKDSLLNKLNAICILELDVANELGIFHISGEYTPTTLTFKDLKKKSTDDKLEIKDFLETMAKANTRGGLI